MAAQLMTISELEKEGRNSPKPIYVLNSSTESAVKANGDIYLSIPKRNGADKDPLRIRQTWLPQNITDVVTRQQLLASSEFRALVQKKLIVIISVRDAERILSQDDAQIERDRLEAEERHVDEAAGSRAITADVKVVGGVGDTDDSDEEQEIPVNLVTMTSEGDGGGDLPKGITDQFDMWIERTALLGDAEAANAVRNHKASYTRSELNYMKAKLTNSPRVQTIVTSTLQKLGAPKAKTRN